MFGFMGLRLAHINRMRRITQTLVRHGIVQLLEGATSGIDAARAGRRLAQALDELGPTFVKLGQVLSTREDMLPAAFVRELAQLQDRATPFHAKVARAQIEASLGSEIVARFARFDDQPLAAGSIAQIHRARTISGDEVVVKVRRPEIERTVEEDIELLEALADQLVRRFPEAARHDPMGFVKEFARGLRAELDFTREAASLTKMREAVGGAALVPRAHLELSSVSVLTMDFIEGSKVSLLTDPAARKVAARRVVACFTDQYLRGELFHADPHAGNLLWQPGGGLAMLDLGAVGAIDPAMRKALRQMAAAAVTRNQTGLARALLTMVHTPANLDRPAVERDLGKLVSAVLGAPLGDVPVSRLVRDVFALAQRHGLRFKAEYFLLFRSSMLVDGVLRGLDPSIDPITAGQAYIMRSFWRPAWLLPAVWLGLYAAARRVVLLGAQAGARVAGVPAAAKRLLGGLPAATKRLATEPSLVMHELSARLPAATRARRMAPAALALVIGVLAMARLGSGAPEHEPRRLAAAPGLQTALAPSLMDDLPAAAPAAKPAPTAPAAPVPAVAKKPVHKPAPAPKLVKPAKPVPHKPAPRTRR
jgi:ubiquinone biosynthesis protein